LPPPFSPTPGQDGDGSEVLAEPARVMTIGHSSQEPAAFVSLLRLHGVTTVVDVRSAPYSRYAPQFNQGALRSLVETAGLRYIWAGDRLGGRPGDPACYRDGVVRVGNLDYGAMARQPSYQEGVRLLLDEAARGLTAVLCSEEDPRRCHRHRLIEPTLHERGVNVLHIRADGALQMIEADEHSIAQLALMGIAS
jgi:uncharacterized protein (DUF488 family)